MEAAEYRIRGKEVVDYIADYLENIRERKVYSNQTPGFLQNVIPPNAPQEGEAWTEIFADVEKLIMPGLLHWQSPHNHAYFPGLTSYPSMLGEMISNAVSTLGFTYASCPAATELEMSVMNWLGRMIGLPEEFMHRKNGVGGGVIQTTSSEATLISLLAARIRSIEHYQKIYEDAEKGEILGKLVAYCSDQAHSSIEKGARISLVNLKYIESDESLSMRGPALLEVIKKDKEDGLIPFWVCATLGTTNSCAFDNLDEIGRVCEEEKLWLHVDAAYAGSAFICPEFRGWMKGIEKVDSLAFNPSKWLMVHFDCTAMWVKNSKAVNRAFTVNPQYLQHDYTGVAVDFMHWQIPLSKRFRSLKLWFVIRNYGVVGLQKHIRETVHLAEQFEALVLSDPRFEVPAQRHLGLVVFALVAGGQATEVLWERINHRGKLHCVVATLKSKYVIRFTVTSQRTTVDDIIKDWNEIKTVATEVLDDFARSKSKVPLADTKVRNATWGRSLLLSNTPTSPKIMDGSFLALYDKKDDLKKWFKPIKLREDAQKSPAMRRRIKGIFLSGKQFSLDSHLDLVHGLEATPGVGEALPPVEDRNETEENEASNAEFVKGPVQKQMRSKSADRGIGHEDLCAKCGHGRIYAKD